MPVPAGIAGILSKSAFATAFDMCAQSRRAAIENGVYHLNPAEE